MGEGASAAIHEPLENRRPPAPRDAPVAMPTAAMDADVRIDLVKKLVVATGGFGIEFPREDLHFNVVFRQVLDVLQRPVAQSTADRRKMIRDKRNTKG